MSTHPADSATKASANNLNRQASLYSIAAAVAGVGVLALAAPAAAEVVVTRKTIPIPLSTTPAPVGVSLSNNGVNDFSFSLNNDSINDRALVVEGANPRNSVVERSFFYAKALALPRGSRIGPDSPFGSGALIEGTQSGNGGRYSRGYWSGNPENHYIGVRFQLKGQTHYGWVRLTVTTNPNPHGPSMSATITGYAYETVPNKPILAGTALSQAELEVPDNIQNQAGPSLGMLARGAESLPLWRREEILTAN